MTADTRKPVMVLSGASGAGHMRAADALIAAFEMRGVPARHVEVLQYTNTLFRKLYSDLYIELIGRGPELLGWVYNALDRPWRFQKRRLALDKLNTQPLIKLLTRERPDLVVCTHFLPAELILYLRRKKKLDIPVGVVVTDFDAHALWLFRGVDWYFVACEETRVYLSEVGIPAESIFVTGIPIDPLFAVEKDRREIRRSLGMQADRTTILVSGGGFGVGSVESIVHGVQKVKSPVQVIAICGRNEELKERLRSISGTAHPLTVVGYTTEMDRWMAASDIIIGKAGGLTSSEALASGLVLVIVNPVPGQEERNSDHFLEAGAALRCNNLPALAYKIDSLLADTGRFTRMREAARRLGRPQAASDIVSIVMGRA